MLHTLLYFLALFSLSSAPNWAKLNHMPVEVLGFYRLGIAALLLGIWFFAIKRFPVPKLSKNIVWVLASGFFFFLHLWTYKYAAKTTSVSNTMIIFSSNPVWASIGAVLFFREKLSLKLVICYILCLLSIYLLVYKDLRFDSLTNYGDLSAVVSALFYACYMLTGKKARHHYENTFYAFAQYLICAVCFGLCVLGEGSGLTNYDSTSWLCVAGLILLPTFLGHLSLTYLLNHMNISIMTCGKLIEPILASLIAHALFQEALAPYAWISFLLTAAAILILFSSSLSGYLKEKFLSSP